MRYASFPAIFLCFSAFGCAQGNETVAGEPQLDATPEVQGIDTGADSSGGDGADTSSPDTAGAVDAADTAASADTADTAASADTADTAASADTADTAASADTADTAASADTADTAASADTADTASSADAADSAAIDSADAGAPWTHTITIDGTNDFTADETFATTSTGYTAYVTWDATYLYFGYAGADIGTTSSSTKWLFAYLDTVAGGATTGEQYNTEKPVMPSGFGADFYVRFRTDDMFLALKKWNGTSWTTVTTTVDHARSGNYVELRVKRADIGATTGVRFVSLMMNEAGGVEAAYAGLYSDNFKDGYYTSVPLTKYLDGDFSLSLAPNATARKKP